jgi:hypothetical protein
MSETTKNADVARTDDLYGLPLGEFTAARNALVKRLRSEGKREEAEQAGAARKPSVAAWAVNQLVRREAKSFEQLLSLGQELREAQSALVGGGEATGVLALSDRERRLVRELVEKAARVFEESGSRASETTLDEVSETLHAAALDEEAAAAVSGGRLVKERRAIGLGLGAGAPAPRRAAPRKQAKPPARVVNARRRLDEARVEAKEARQAADAADRAFRRAEREASQAARAAEQAAERERKAAEALERAEAKD